MQMQFFFDGKDKSVECMMPVFPEPPTPGAVAARKEFRQHHIAAPQPVTHDGEFEARANELCASFDKGAYQHFVETWLSARTPYQSILLYHGLGVGKTCSAVTIAETLLHAHRAPTSAALPPPVFVITSRSLQKSFQNEIFSMTAMGQRRCTQEIYIDLIAALPPALDTQAVHSIISQRYAFYTYEGFATLVDGMTDAQLRARFSEVTVIVDEAHNLRDTSEGGQGKRAAAAMVRALTIGQGQNNRLVLLSATPMFNEPEEILFLMALLCINEGRKDLHAKRLPHLLDKNGAPVPATWQLVERLAQRYVSYVRSQNPFTFAMRLSPKASGIPVLDAPAWTRKVRDGLVESRMGGEQEAAFQAVRGKKTAMTNLLQMCNLVIPTAMGKRNAAVKYRMGRAGLMTIARNVDDARPLQVDYRSKNATLDPKGAWLAECSPKMVRIADLVQSARGIVIIFSQFVWSGVVPMAMALEHAGFRRFHDRDLLSPPAKPDAPNLARTPRYVILCDHDDVRGTLSITQTVRHLNAMENQDGGIIKVVLMTPVASEGLSLLNVREVHMMDPWYHFNRAEQVIGRAIRKCSHGTLPVPERNVTVFLHALTAADPEQETPDMAAYRIATEKQAWIQKVDRALRANAIDCALFENQNHLPRSLFQFELAMRTSQGASVRTQLGDADEERVACANPGSATVAGHGTQDEGWRWETFAHWIPTLRLRVGHAVQREVERGNAPRYVDFKELWGWMDKASSLDGDVLKAAALACVAPHWVWQSWQLVPYRKGLWLRKNDGSRLVPASTKRMLSPPGQATEEMAPGSAPTSRVATWDDVFAAHPMPIKGLGLLVHLYKHVNSLSWPSLAERAVRGDAPEVVRQALAAAGALVRAREVGRAGAKERLAGYLDIFAADYSTGGLPMLLVHDAKTDTFREALAAERQAFRDARRWEPPPTAAASSRVEAMMVPHRTRADLRKDPAAPLRMVFKLVRPTDAAAGAERARRITGIECDSLKMHELDALMDTFGVPSAEVAAARRIADKCAVLAVGMQTRGRLWLPPGWRPKN